MADAWNPEQYERFKTERARPFHDLVAMVARRAGMRTVDLGCGTGELTRYMHDRLTAEDTTGVDSSAAMLGKAAPHVGDGLTFVEADIATWAPDGPVDLVFSNAALHWLPDHDALLDRLVGWLGEKGQLAVQVPANHTHPSQTIAAQLATEAPYVDQLGGYVAQRNVREPEHYAALLYRLGLAHPTVRLEIYGHELPSAGHVVQWTTGSTLTAYADRLPADLYEQFVAEYSRRLLPELGDSRPYYFPFRRILMHGSKL